MASKRDYKFKLPKVVPVRFNKTAHTSIQNYEKSLSIPKDNIRLTPQVDFLIEKLKQGELNSRLTKKRQQAIAILEKQKNLWANLEQKELAFQRTIISHNKFLKRNLEKRERAIGKIQTDMDLTKKREREIKIMDQKYDFFNAVLVKMRFEIKQHSIYETYLKRVVDHSDSPFKMVQELLAKFESLQAIKNYCMEKQKREMSITIQMHDRNLEFFRDRIVTLIGLKNQLSALSTRYDEVVRKSIAGDILVCEIMNKCNSVAYETNMTQQMINVIYRYIYERRQQTFKIPQSNVLELKMDAIKQTMSAWAEMQADDPEKANRVSRLMLLRQRFEKTSKKDLSLYQKKN